MRVGISTPTGVCTFHEETVACLPLVDSLCGALLVI